MGGEPGNEAHGRVLCLQDLILTREKQFLVLLSLGGYTFCGLASLMLINKTSVIDVDRLLVWPLFRPPDSSVRSKILTQLTDRSGLRRGKCNRKAGFKEEQISWSTAVTRFGSARSSHFSSFFSGTSALYYSSFFSAFEPLPQKENWQFFDLLCCQQ